MKNLKNKIQKIVTKKKKTDSTNLFIIDKISKIIDIKRIFFINSENSDIRGNHGHKKCTQVFVSLKGVIKIEIYNDGSVEKRYILK